MARDLDDKTDFATRVRFRRAVASRSLTLRRACVIVGVVHERAACAARIGAKKKKFPEEFPH